MKETKAIHAKTGQATQSERFHSGFEDGGNGMLLIECVKQGYARSAKLRIEEGHDINEQDENGMTALHYAAALGARQCLRALVSCGKCDYLLKDNLGRYASELAFSCAKDYAVGVLLQKKQAMQAFNQGVPAWDKNSNIT